MNIAKALKTKNKIAGEIAALKLRLNEQNVRTSKQEYDYQNAEVLGELLQGIDALVKIKSALARANVPVYDKIFRLAELKGMITALKSLPTREGTESIGYGPTASEVTYKSQLGKKAIDDKVAELEAQVQALQDELDQFNFTTLVEA